MGKLKRIKRTGTVTVTVPVLIERDDRPGSEWEVSSRISDTPFTPLHVQGGTTEAEAKDGFARLVITALARYSTMRPILVVGGDVDYADRLHLVIANPWGCDVLVYRMGSDKPGCSWTLDGRSPDEALALVLEHVGGDPAVVRF